MLKAKAGETVTSQRETQATPCPANEQGTRCQYKSQGLTHPVVRRAERAPELWSPGPRGPGSVQPRQHQTTDEEPTRQPPRNFKGVRSRKARKDGGIVMKEGQQGEVSTIQNLRFWVRPCSRNRTSAENW